MVVYAATTVRAGRGEVTLSAAEVATAVTGDMWEAQTQHAFETLCPTFGTF